MSSESAGPRLEDLVTILYRPRETMRRILDGGKERWTIQIVILAVILTSISDPDLRHLEDVLPGLNVTSILALVVVGVAAGVLIWTVMLYVFSWVVAFAGRLLGGVGTAPDVRAALAWCAVPAIWSVIYRIPVAIYKYRLEVRPDADPKKLILQIIEHGGCAIAVILMALQVLLYAWTLFVASNTVGEAHRFSSWKGLATVTMTVALPVIVMAAAVFTLRR